MDQRIFMECFNLNKDHVRFNIANIMIQNKLCKMNLGFKFTFDLQTWYWFDEYRFIHIGTKFISISLTLEEMLKWRIYLRNQISVFHADESLLISETAKNYHINCVEIFS